MITIARLLGDQVHYKYQLDNTWDTTSTSANALPHPTEEVLKIAIDALSFKVNSATISMDGEYIGEIINGVLEINSEKANKKNKLIRKIVVKKCD